MWEAYPLVGNPAFVLTLQSGFELIPKVKQEGCWLNTGRGGGRKINVSKPINMHNAANLWKCHKIVDLDFS